MTARFKLIAGKHLEGKIRYQTGDIVSSEHDLAKLFGSTKFQYIDGAAEPPQAEKDKIDSVPQNQPGYSASVTPIPKLEPEPEPKVATGNPKNATEQFESAVQSNLIVHKIGRKYWIKEPQTNDYLNDGGLNKAQAVGFIEEYMDAE